MLWRRFALALAATLLPLALLAWTAFTPGGLRLAARLAESALPGLQLNTPDGRLLGPLRFARIVYATGERRIVAEDIEIAWQPRRLTDGLLAIDRLTIGRLSIAGGRAGRFEPPVVAAPPVAVEIHSVRIGSVLLVGGTELSHVEGGVAIDARRYRIDRLSFRTAKLDIEASGELSTAAPFTVAATARIAGEAAEQPFVVMLDAHGRLHALTLAARTVSGPLAVHGKALVDALADQPIQRAEITATKLDPAAWFEGAPHGRLDVDATVVPADGGLRADVSIRNGAPGRLDQGRLPLRRLTLQARRERKAIVVDHFAATFVRGSAAGTARWADGHLALNARLSGVDASAWHRLPKPTQLGGTIQLEAAAATQHLRAELHDPRFQLSLDVERSGRELHIAAARLAAASGSLKLAGHTTAAGDYRFAGRLNNFDPSALANVPRARLNASLEARGHFGDRPSANLHFVLEDSTFADRAITGHGDVALREDELAGVEVKVRAGDNQFELRGRIGTAPGRLTATVEAPQLAQVGLSGALYAEAALDGRLREHRLELAAHDGSGRTLHVAAHGGLSDGRWTGTLERLDWSARQSAHLLGNAQLEIGADRLIVGRAEFAGDEWRATLDGLQWAAGRLQSRGRFKDLPVAPWLSAVVPDSTLRLGGEWNLTFADAASGKVRIFRQQGDLTIAAGEQRLPLGLSRLEVTAEFRGRTASMVLLADSERTGAAEGRLEFGLADDERGWHLARRKPWRGLLRLNAPSIGWLSPLIGEGVGLDGRLNAAVSLGGTPAMPALLGRVDGEGLRVRQLDYGVDLGQGVLRLAFTPDLATVEHMEFISVASARPREARIPYKRLAAHPGRLVAAGAIALGSGEGRIDLRAERLTVFDRPDNWLMVSGTGAVQFAAGGAAITGQLAVDAAYLETAPAGQPALSSDVTVLNREDKRTRRPPADLELDLRLGDNFYFSGEGIDSRLAGEVHLSSRRGAPWLAQGSVRTVHGVFSAYGRELSIDRGILNFQGLADNPGLNVRALRKNLPVEAGVEVTGTLKRPQVRLVSEPDVPDAEKLSWMVLGRPPGTGVGAQDADLLLSAAMALRGGQGKGPLRSLAEGLGLEEFGVSSGSLAERGHFGGGGHVAGSFAASGTAEQIATVGKRISSNAVLSYERSLTSAESVVKLTVDLSRRLSIVARVGADNAVMLVYSFVFGWSHRK